MYNQRSTGLEAVGRMGGHQSPFWDRICASDPSTWLLCQGGRVCKPEIIEGAGPALGTEHHLHSKKHRLAEPLEIRQLPHSLHPCRHTEAQIGKCVPGPFSCAWLFATLLTVPTRLLCLWDSPGKNTGVFCHFLLHWIFLTHPGIELMSCMSPALVGGFFATSATWETPR